MKKTVSYNVILWFDNSSVELCYDTPEEVDEYLDRYFEKPKELVKSIDIQRVTTQTVFTKETA